MVHMNRRKQLIHLKIKFHFYKNLYIYIYLQRMSLLNWLNILINIVTCFGSYFLKTFSSEDFFDFLIFYIKYFHYFLPTWIWSQTVYLLMRKIRNLRRSIYTIWHIKDKLRESYFRGSTKRL